MMEDEGGRQRSPEPEFAETEGDMDADAAMDEGDRGAGDAAAPRAESTATLVISQADARFLIGTKGATKRKLMRVSRAKFEIAPVDGDAEENQTVTISGTEEAVARAKQYAEWVLRQRVGKIIVDTSTPRDDMSVVDVPPSCTAYITGKQGQGLRRIEADTGTLMFFGKPTTDPEDAPEKLIILGSRKARRGSELQVMSSIERKVPGTYVSADKKLTIRFNQPGDGLGDGWGFDVFPFADEEELSFAVGREVRRARCDLMRYVLLFFSSLRTTSRSVRRTTMSDVRSLEALSRANNKFCLKYAGVFCLAAVGQYAVQRVNAFMSTRTSIALVSSRSRCRISTLTVSCISLHSSQGCVRRKVSKAAGCPLEYVGLLAVMTGDRAERARCWDYIRWLMKQQKGTLTNDIALNERDDVTTLPVKAGFGGISRIYGKGGDTLRQIESITGTFCFNIPDPSDVPEQELMLIFSHNARARERARDLMRNVLQTGRIQAGGGGRRGGGGGGPTRCFDFSVGRCTRGDSCRWAHIVPPGPPGPPQRRGGPSRGRGRENREQNAKPYGKASDKWGSGARRGGRDRNDDGINGRLTLE